MYIYIYIYRERERDRYIYVYMYIFRNTIRWTQMYLVSLPFQLRAVADISTECNFIVLWQVNEYKLTVNLCH